MPDAPSYPTNAAVVRIGALTFALPNERVSIGISWRSRSVCTAISDGARKSSRSRMAHAPTGIGCPSSLAPAPSRLVDVVDPEPVDAAGIATDIIAGQLA